MRRDRNPLTRERDDHEPRHARVLRVMGGAPVAAYPVAGVSRRKPAAAVGGFQPAWAARSTVTLGAHAA